MSLNKILMLLSNKYVFFGIIGFCVLIAFIIVYRLIKLKIYRKDVVELENRMNAIKTLPIQYRLGRVKGISKNMPELVDKYKAYASEYQQLNEFLNNDIVALLTDIDEALFYRKLKGVKKDIEQLTQEINDYETRSKELLKKIEVITEIENVQRLEIIKVKEKYRATNDTYASVRFKIEDFVPIIPQTFENIDQRFVDLENDMNNQDFDSAKKKTASISKDIDLLDANLRDLPTYISIVRQYFPKRIEELKRMIANMKEHDFALERLNTSIRMNKIEQDLENVTADIKSLKLENVGQTIEVMTEDMNELNKDFEKEEAAYEVYAHKRNECYQFVQKVEQGLTKGVKSLNSLKKNYILDDYPITVEEDYDQFKEVLDELGEVTRVIESKDFSYASMIEQLDAIQKKAQPFYDSLLKYNEIDESLKIQEKRAMDELDNINIVLLEIKSEIKNKHLPMISESYKDYIEDSYQKADAILNFIRKRPIDLASLSSQVDAARDVIYKLYDNVHNLIVTAEMVEDAIVYGNRFRSSFLEVNTELTKAELLFRNGEYTKALSTAVEIIEKIKPGSYEMLVNKNSPKTSE